MLASTLAQAGSAAGLAPSRGLPKRGGARVAVVASASSSDAQQQQEQQQQQQQSRRALLAAAALLLPATALPAVAEEAAAAAAPSSAAQSTTYTDAEDKFTITVPAGWEVGTGALGAEGTMTSTQARFSNAAGLRRVVALVPSGKPEVSVAVTVQFLGADYTGLGSFGTATDFATGVVTQMDTSYILRLPEWRRAKEGPVQIATLIDAKEVDQGAKQYRFNYTLEKEGEPNRCVYQSIAIGNNGRVNRFFTVNASCTEADCAKYEPMLKEIVASFTPPPLPST